MFENIETKNAFINEDKIKQNKYGATVYVIDAEAETYIAKTWDKDYAEFIAYCFNLQQHYDISKLKEAVKFIEHYLQADLLELKTISELEKMAEQLLKQMKK